VHHVARHLRHRRQQRQRLDPLLALGVDQRHALGDVLGIVADPLDHRGDLERGDHFAQIVGHRRAQRDDADDELLDLGLDRVDRLVLLATTSSAPARCRRAGAPSSRRRSPASASPPICDQRAELLDVLVERLDGMFLALAISRTFR
jgi:hypothetical protein